MSVFFFSLPSITPKDTQEMNLKATLWDAHPCSVPTQVWVGAGGGVLPQPPSSLFLQDLQPGGAQLVRTLSGGAEGNFRTSGARGGARSL